MPPFQIDRDGSQTTEPFIGSAPGLMRSELTLYGPLAESFSALPCNSVVGELACCQFVPALIVMTAAPGLCCIISSFANYIRAAFR